ncbi:MULTISPECIES: hypothetical protein [Olivibacter]|uniref:Uncharacterized protein n=1 Tax=Olivibacter jilunii TaxID=985016 RepID=A0ABW6B1E1_9SPHI
MFNFYFELSSPTEWLQVVIGFLGICGLLWTLILQRQTLKSQMEVQRMEAKSHTANLFPEFEITISQHTVDPDLMENTVSISLQILLKKNMVHDVRVELIKSNFDIIEYDNEQLKIPTDRPFVPGQTIRFMCSFDKFEYNNKYDSIYFEDNRPYFDYYFGYSDTLGNRYAQGIRVFAYKNYYKQIAMRMTRPNDQF